MGGIVLTQTEVERRNECNLMALIIKKPINIERMKFLRPLSLLSFL